VRFLQTRPVVALQDQAVPASASLPAQYRDPFVNGFSNAAHSGFEVGAGQTGTTVQLPAQVQEIAHYVFTHAFVDAMHPPLILPIAVLVLAAISTAFVRSRKAAPVAVHKEEAAVA